MHDVLVVGGGPAGGAAAALLARWGHSVTLVSKRAADTRPLGESIPPSTGKLFDLIGVRRQVDAAGFVRATGNTVWWGSRTPRVEYFANGERGWQVTAGALERLLRECSAACGARIEVRSFDASQDVRRHAFVLDCTGRTAIFARKHRLRVHDPSVRTIAMVAVWQSPRFLTAEPTHTVIESYEGGWAWSVPCAERSPRAILAADADRQHTDHIIRRFVAVMIDPRRSDVRRTHASENIYRFELRKAPALTRLLADAELIEGPRGWDASMYHALQYVADNVLLVGDAGSFIDPLSSAGIQKALASGWLAAVATHTSLMRPHMRQVALDFFEAREREIYRSFRGLTERYWRDAAAGHEHPFWSDRARFDDTACDGDGLAAAFERLKAEVNLRVARNPAARVERCAAVSASEIVLEPRLVSQTHPTGIRYAYDVDLVTLVELAPEYDSVPALFEAYNRRCAPVALPDFLGALSSAIAQRWLLWCDTY